MDKVVYTAEAVVEVDAQATVGPPMAGSQTQHSTYQGRDASGRFRVTQAATRQGNRWTIVGLHYSPIASQRSPRPSSTHPGVMHRFLNG